jgi:hypothetical protein
VTSTSYSKKLYMRPTTTLTLALIWWGCVRVHSTDDEGRYFEDLSMLTVASAGSAISAELGPRWSPRRDDVPVSNDGSAVSELDSRLNMINIHRKVC